MGINSGKTPKITWGSGFANTLRFGYPLDGYSSYVEAREGSEVVKSSAGTFDSWRTGTDFFLKGQYRWIPTTDSTLPVSASGWDGTTGVSAFIQYAQDMNLLRFYPDQNSSTFISCYLSSPVGPNSVASAVTVEADATRNLAMTLYSSGSDFAGY